MPRKEIDYSNTHIYKIVCKDLNIKGCYVGHTTDFKTRKGCHKRVCYNRNDKNHHLPLYQFIRENGGWDNFDMVLIETVNCPNSLEARKHERERMEQEQSTLNKVRACSSLEEQRENCKRYYNDNKGHVLEKKKERYESNKEHYLQEMKQYRETHTEQQQINHKKWVLQHQDRVKENHKRWCEENKEHLREKQQQTTTCECGAVCQSNNYLRHLKTRKHQDYLTSFSPEESAFQITNDE